MQDAMWLLIFLVFFAVPGHFLVFGKRARRLQRDFLSNPEERARQAEVVKRLLVWLVSAGLVGSLWSLLLMTALN